MVMRTNYYSKYQRLVVKDVKNMLGCSYTKAYQVMCDMKEQFKVQEVLFCHFEDYFKVPKSK